VGSNPTSSVNVVFGRMSRAAKGAGCKPAVTDFVGSSPTSPTKAGIAQLVELLICNQAVGGSNPSVSMLRK